MNNTSFKPRHGIFAKLRCLTKSYNQSEQCEYCSVAVGAQHRHILEIASRKISCTCDACALLFENAMGGRKLIPRDSRALSGFQMTDAEWESLGLPIGLAFFFRSSATRRVVGMYPSPAGATESLLPLRSWQALEQANPCLLELEADVEALLVNRIGTAREYYIAPIDLCFELVGLIRLHWRGFSGGDQVFQKLAEFFTRMGGVSHSGSEQGNTASEPPLGAPTSPRAGGTGALMQKSHA